MYETLLAAEPDSEEALSNLIAMNVERRDFERTSDYAERLLEICPQSTVALQGLATAAFGNCGSPSGGGLLRSNSGIGARSFGSVAQLTYCDGPVLLQRWALRGKTMTRLRVRVELNRRKSGVPMEELVSVVEETRKFFHLLAEDVEIPADRGEWLASNFDPESLNFTAEFNGPVSTEQIRAFGSAFGGATSLRRETIAQFTHIADFIGEDELVGFGLYQTDEESEPSDWRCLSRRDAQRFAGEIQLLAKAAGVSEVDSPLPAVMNGSVGGRRLFKDRREREALAADPSKWIREVESSLASRIGLLESKLEAQAQQVEGLGNSQEVAEERFLKLLGAMESAWSQGPRQLTAPAAELVAQPLEPRNGWKFGLGFTAAALILATVGAAQFGSVVAIAGIAGRTARSCRRSWRRRPAQSVASIAKPTVVEAGACAEDQTNAP